MKNHLGTFINQGTETGTGDASSTGLHSLDAVFNINKHAAILGGSPVRQQLCIVDGLLANGGNSAVWSIRTDRIVMGTFAPIVDYFTATKILLNSTIMAGGPMPAAGVTSAATLVPQFLTSFGYAATDALQWVECTPPNWPAITSGSGGSSGSGGAGGNGGTSATGGARSGGTSAAAGTGGGGTSAAGGAGGGGRGTSAAGGAGGDTGTSAAGGAGGAGGDTGASAGVGADSGGATAAGGASDTGGTVSGGAGATAATSATWASGGSATTGGASPTTGTGASSRGGSSGTTGATVSRGNSGTGCSVAEVHSRVTRWSALLAFGAVVAEKLRRLVSNDGRSS
jgi:hypothetical protein